MKTVNVSELKDAALDWAVAKCEGHEIDSLMGGAVWYWLRCSLTGDLEVVEIFKPSTDWAQGGVIIEREIGNLWKHNKLDPNEPDVWTAAAYCKASDGTMLYYEDGPTPLIAAMRCYVSSRIGDTIDIPDCLINL